MEHVTRLELVPRRFQNLRARDVGSTVAFLDGLLRQVNGPGGATALVAISYLSHDQLLSLAHHLPETSSFLAVAMLISLSLIFFILITQFGSLSKSLIILSEVLFSIIGVFLGIVIFKMDISVIMTGLGIVALGGIVVRNGILIVEFSDVLKTRGMKTREAIIQAGKTRITPVILTATATMLGLVPLAVGMNINFITMFTELNPHIYFGGDNVMFWGPLSWTIIFGLSFATFLTLIFVPAMVLIDYRMTTRIRNHRWQREKRRRMKQALSE